MRRVRIAGGGISGLTAAVVLARRGLAVEVVERRRGWGGRFAGGWQVLENGTSRVDALAELAAVGLGSDPPARPIHAATLLDGRGGVHHVSSRRPYAYFVRRGAGDATLDGWLRRQAEAAGVTLSMGSDADGADLIATGPAQADGVAREMVFSTDLSDTVLVLFDPALTPTGYAYLFAVSGHATFGVAQVRKVAGLKRASELAWERFRAVTGPFTVEDAREGGQFMSFSLPASLRDGAGTWYAGEAAGVQDFLFGLGNRLAIRSAALAAGGIVGAWDEAGFRRTVVRPMRTSIGLRRFYESLGVGGFALLCRWLAAGDFRRRLVLLQRPDPVKLLLGTVAARSWRQRGGCRHGTLCSWCRVGER